MQELHQLWFWVRDSQDYVAHGLIQGDLDEAHVWALKMKKQLSEFILKLEEIRSAAVKP